MFKVEQSLQNSKTSDFKCSYEALVQKGAFTLWYMLGQSICNIFVCLIIVLQLCYDNNDVNKYKKMFCQLVSLRIFILLKKISLFYALIFLGFLRQKRKMGQVNSQVI